MLYRISVYFKVQKLQKTPSGSFCLNSLQLHDGIILNLSKISNYKIILEDEFQALELYKFYFTEDASRESFCRLNGK